MGLGQFKREDPEEQREIEEAKRRWAEEEKRKAESIEVGDRCEVTVRDQIPRMGTVRFVGTTDFASGYWVGVHYDEPYGRNDGSVQGKRYFECGPRYGSFVKPKDVTVGDFLEDDLVFNDEEI